MLKNYFLTAYRSLVKSKGYAILNITGLAAGLTCFALIALWVNDELSYDKFNKHYNNIYRLTTAEKRDGSVTQLATSGAPVAAALLHDYPEVDKAVRLKMREEIVTYQNQQVLQGGILLTDPPFFDVFSYKLTKGNAATALSKPYSLVLTKSTAKQYFADKDPVGQVLLLNMYDSTGYGANYTVTGVMDDPPQNAHFTFNMLASFKTIETARPKILSTEGWEDASFYTYVLLKKGVEATPFANKMATFYRKYVGDARAKAATYQYDLQPLADIHLHSHLKNELATNGSITQVYIFLTIGIFILLLAGINYTNLATARSVSRAREAGVKKVLGAGRQHLVWQYLSESVLTALLALLPAIAICYFLQPVFNQVTGKQLSLLGSPLLLCLLTGITIALGLLAGLYPAFIIAAYKPVVVLKGAFKASGKGIILRKVLVVSQFAVTMVLITGIVIIYSQMNYIKFKDLGYNKDALITIKVNGNTDIRTGYDAFTTELLANPLVSGQATSNSLIVGGLGSAKAEIVDARGSIQQVNTAYLRIDENYLAVYGIKLLAGNNFNPQSAVDSLRPVILNQTAVRSFGWKDNNAAIGKPFSMDGNKGVVIGVVADFTYTRLEEAIGPLAISPVSRGGFSRITLKINALKAREAADFTSQVWKRHFPGALFDYDFVSQQIKAQYLAEERFTTIFLSFSVLSLLIACLGLYGLIGYTVVQKTKEIGIRKVLGATPGRIAAMLTADFLQLVLIACFIAIPAAWFIMQSWLQGFAYRVSLTWWMFGGAGLLVLLVALSTVGMQSIKAAFINPAKSLKIE